ncbi:phosphoribosyltransferase-like protein [Idiomarina baltica]|uniref:Uncharacterized protein n=1 Tax=Idiomarina baltica OS145 TaxID=314276 RepID=A0ABM9WLF1_9GAMM|nr:hypothetical protein [Idiomarina baltica]EAQ31779.1 hypothetical protein OS145_06744 [Idiomarina baltica OS145]
MASLTIINQIKFSETEPGKQWCSQFGHNDRHYAEKLINALYWVSEKQFKVYIAQQLQEVTQSQPAACFCEREPRKRNGKILPYYKSPRRKRNRKFYGVAMSPIPTENAHRHEVGSEGVISNIITSSMRENPNKVLLHPTAQALQKKKVKQYVIVTDLIGSGTRISNVLDSFWAVPSIRALHSAKLINFIVIAYATSRSGRGLVSRHQLNPEIRYETESPSFKDAFSDSEELEIRQFLNRYTKKNKSGTWGSIFNWHDPLLTVFSHGAPNNLPEIMFKPGLTGIKPLFKGRSTSRFYEYSSKFESQILPVPNNRGASENEYLEWLLKQPLRHRHIFQVLSVIGKAKSLYQIMDFTGLKRTDIVSVLELSKAHKWIDDYHITDRGRYLRDHLKSKPVQVNSKGLEQQESELYYCPQSLGAPLY